MMNEILTRASTSLYGMIVLISLDEKKTEIKVGARGLGGDERIEIVNVPIDAIRESLRLKGWDVMGTAKGFMATRHRSSVRSALSVAA